MRFQFVIFHKTSIHIAVEKENIEILQILLSHPEIDVNAKTISISKSFHIISTFQFSLHFNFEFESHFSIIKI